MAERRMFAKTIVLSDAFLDMPMSARCLYFTLGMLADDEGFVGNPKAIMRQCGASQDDMLALIQKRYVLGFESGVIVIKHWKLNNYLRSDRFTATTYIEEKETLTEDEKGSYTEKNKSGIPLAYQTPTISTPSIGKDSIGKVSIGESNKAARHKYGEYLNVLLTDEEFETWKKECPLWSDYIEKLSGYMKSSGKSYKSHLATLRNWYRRDKEKAESEVTHQSYDLEKVKEQSTKPIVYARKDK